MSPVRWKVTGGEVGTSWTATRPTASVLMGSKDRVWNSSQFNKYQVVTRYCCNHLEIRSGNQSLDNYPETQTMILSHPSLSHSFSGNSHYEGTWKIGKYPPRKRGASAQTKLARLHSHITTTTKAHQPPSVHAEKRKSFGHGPRGSSRCITFHPPASLVPSYHSLRVVRSSAIYRCSGQWPNKSAAWL